MSDKHLTDKALIWRVLNEAYENIDGLADAHSHVPGKVVDEAKATLARIDEYALRKYGQTVTAARGKLDHGERVSLFDLPVNGRKDFAP